MKIGINLLCFNKHNLAGTWFFVKRLIEALPACDDLEFQFFCQRGFDLEQHLTVPAGIRWCKFESCVSRSRFLRIVYEQIVMPFRGLRLDVLFSPCVANPVLHPFCRTITSVHDLTPFFVAQKYGVLQGWYVRLMTRLLLRCSDHIITVSQNSRRDLVHMLAVDPRKITIIYNFLPEHTGVVSPIRYDNYFLYVGTLQPGKNLASVLRAFSIFCEKYDTQQHRLVIVGARGPGKSECPKLVRELGLGPRVRFAGYVSDRELKELYAHCKALVLLSLYEGFGIPPLEALHWYKPSIVSNVSSLPEVVGDTGIQVDPLDCGRAAMAMRDIAENPQAYLGGREEQLRVFSQVEQVWKFLQVLRLYKSVTAGS